VPYHSRIVALNKRELMINMPSHQALNGRSVWLRRKNPRPCTWLAQTKMPRSDEPDDSPAVDVEVAKDELDAYSAAGARQQMMRNGVDPEAFDAGFRFMQQLDELQQQQRAQHAFEAKAPAEAPAAAAGPSIIPWGSILGIVLGGLILTGKVNIFAIIGEAVSGFVLLIVGLPLVLIGAGRWAWSALAVEGLCPVCGEPVTLVKAQTIPCLSCGTMLVVEKGKPARAADFTTQVDLSGRQTRSRNVVDVEVEVVDDKRKG